ncbi:YjbF family lipoprotein [Aeromonas caviae]|uniref:YjbF family lipoprotein n=2 Tax=Aeromonas caviae TaxID=648 RepID=UPI00192040F3|nr:YjbF family lipoprotein [Aeromonas caviae]MBL0578944.1 YjbF family lipoprotein [Aeromonas caviae]
MTTTTTPALPRQPDNIQQGCLVQAALFFFLSLMDGLLHVAQYSSYFPTRLLALSATLLLAGCSTSMQKTIETFGYVFNKPDDIVLTSSELRALPYASAYIKVGDVPQALVILAYVDGPRMSWVSADGVMFVTQYGRLIKTVGLPNDLRYLGSLDKDPLKTSRLDKTPSMVWYSVAEWSKKYTSGYPLSMHYTQAGNEVLNIMDHSYKTTIVEEHVVTAPDEERWLNLFWIDEQTGQVRKFQQQLGPSLPMIEMTFLKPYSS